MRAYITKQSGGSKTKVKEGVIWADDVQDHKMEDRLGLLNATIKLRRSLSRQERLKERAEKEQDEIRLEVWNRVRNVDERLLRAGINIKRKHKILQAGTKLKAKHNSQEMTPPVRDGKKIPEEQNKEKVAIQDRSLDERLLQAATKLKVKHHGQEMTPRHVRDKEKSSNENGDEATRDDNHSPLDDRLLNPTIKLKAKRTSTQNRIANPKQKNRLLHPTIKARERIIIISGPSGSLDSQHDDCENYHSGSSAALISETDRSVHSDVAQANSHDTSLGKPFQKRKMRFRKLKGDDNSNSSLAVGSDGKIHYNANTSVQSSSVASTQTGFDLLAIDETKPQQTLTTQTKSPMAGLFGAFWGCSTTMDAQLDSEKKLQDNVQANEDMLDFVFNDVEAFACRKEEEDLRDTRILPKPALKYEKDALDKVCEPMESMACQADSNEPGVTLTKNTQGVTQCNQGRPKGQTGKNIQDEGLLGYVFNDVKSLVSHHQVNQNYEMDVLDKVFEPLESMVCRHDVPEARRKVISDQNERIGDRLHESAIRSAAFREAEARTTGIQSGTGPIPLVLQYDERDVLDNVFESMESLACRGPLTKAKHQRQKSAFEAVESKGYRDDSPTIGGDWESNKRDKPIEQSRNVGPRASRIADGRDNVESIICKQDAQGFRGNRNLIAKKEKYYTHGHKNAVDPSEEMMERMKQSILKSRGDLLDFKVAHVESAAVCKEGMPEYVLKKERPKRKPNPKWRSRHPVVWRDE